MILYRLDRMVENDKGCAGMLYRNDELLCATLEPPLTRAHPAIPPGQYPLHWTYSPRLEHSTPRVMNVPGRTGILIHGGNRIEDTQGCILVGKKWAEGADMIFLSQSRIMKELVYYHVQKDTMEGGYALIKIVPRGA